MTPCYFEIFDLFRAYSCRAMLLCMCINRVDIVKGQLQDVRIVSYKFKLF